MEPKQKATLGLAVCVGLWFAFLLTPCGIYHNWLPMFNLMFVAFLPVPVIVGGLGKNSEGEAQIVWAAFGTCLGAFIVVAMFGYPIVLLHAAKIHAKEFAWLMAGDLILVVGGTYFGRQLNDEDDGYQAF